jgi:hypothetical protein
MVLHVSAQPTNNAVMGKTQTSLVIARNTKGALNFFVFTKEKSKKTTGWPLYTYQGTC